MEILDKLPEDIQYIIYNKIIYPQPADLLAEIRSRYAIYNILCTFNREKDLKPTIDNVYIAMKDLPMNKLKKFVGMMKQVLKDKKK